MTEKDTTRRELLRGGVAATSTVALAATVPSLLDPAGVLAAPVGDAAVVVSLLRVEHVVGFAYEHALAAGAMSLAAQQVLTSFRAHERAHVHALSLSARSLGATVPAPPMAMAAFEAELRQLRVRRNPAGLRGERQHLRFLVALETIIARHYRFAIARLSAERQLLTAAQIMADEAQHATVLLELLSPGNVKRAVPSAFVAGMT